MSDLNNKNTNSHFWWVIAILSFALIAMVATFIVMKTDQKVHHELIEILGILSTLLAIVLSIFSIAFSYKSSSKADSTLEHVGFEVNKIETTYTNLTKFFSGMRDAPNPNPNKDNKSLDQMIEKMTDGNISPMQAVISSQAEQVKKTGLDDKIPKVSVAKIPSQQDLDRLNK